ncbi:hypothetical protein [Burkholderia ubonensis]|uniref:hypothetical protein n=1 Tax=Burkholderia ubonensis TaxID=101571 RepID=UPI00016A59E2|nr:hypothetical protein [Burkholderia ubonensis]
MTEPITIRRVSGDEVTAYIDALSDVLIDCVEGGRQGRPRARHGDRQRCRETV